MLAGEDVGPFRGGGRLSWQAGSEIRVQAETDGAESLMRSFGRAPAGLGQLIPHSAYISATGQTHDGWDISTTPVVADGYHVSSDSPHVVWDFSTHGLSLTRTTSGVQYRTLRASWGLSPRTWVRSSETVVNNDYFSQRVGLTDWLLCRADVRRRGSPGVGSDEWWRGEGRRAEGPAGKRMRRTYSLSVARALPASSSAVGWFSAA